MNERGTDLREQADAPPRGKGEAMGYHERVPNSPDELIRTWASLPNGGVSVLIPTATYRRLLGVVEQAVPGGMCSIEHAGRDQSLSVEELVEIALLHYLDNDVLWDNG